jgi:DNA-binding NtrC family response regulator
MCSALRLRARQRPRAASRRRAGAENAGAAAWLDDLRTDVPEAPALAADTALARRPTLDEVERRYITATLRHARGNQTEAARLLGISRKALWEKRKRYGLD